VGRIYLLDIGLTIGSLAAFGLGRWLGDSYVRNLVRKDLEQVGLSGAEGTFSLHHLSDPCLTKDIICYIFGLSPMPFCGSSRFRRSAGFPAPGCSPRKARRRHRHYIELIVLTIMWPPRCALYYYPTGSWTVPGRNQAKDYDKEKEEARETARRLDRGEATRESAALSSWGYAPVNQTGNEYRAGLAAVFLLLSHVCPLAP